MPQEIPQAVLFDVRLVERHIRSGLTTREAYEQWLASTRDATEDGDRINLDDLVRQMGHPRPREPAAAAMSVRVSPLVSALS